MSVTIASPDRFVRWPLYSGAVILAILSVSLLLPAPLAIVVLLGLWLPVAGLGLLGAVVAILWCAPAALFKGQWRRALSMLALPMVLLTVPSTEAARWVRDETRFYIHKGTYEAKVAEAKIAGKHIAWVDDWSIFFDDWSIFFNANDFVVWDEWDDPEIASGFTVKQRFGAHFYLVGD